MSIQNIQNILPFQNVQNYPSEQKLQNSLPSQAVQNQNNIQSTVASSYCEPAQNNQTNNYIPRYMPLVQQGQVYSVPVPQQPQQSPKGGSVGAVNITINGVNTPGQPQPAQPYYQPYIPYCVPQPPTNIQAAEIKKEPLAATTIEKKGEDKPPVEKKPEKTKAEDKNPKKPVIQLTNEYIKKLEENLNDKDQNLRGHAIAELLKRFKENENLKDEPRLTNLMNKALQDSSKTNVLGAMEILENGYANGNSKTIERLNAIVEQNDTFGNSETAKGILTKIEGTKTNSKNINAVTPISDSVTSPIKENNEKNDSPAGSKLDLMAE